MHVCACVLQLILGWYAIHSKLLHSRPGFVGSFMQTPKCNQNQAIWIFNFVFFSLSVESVKWGKCFDVGWVFIVSTINAFMRFSTNSDESVLKMKVYGALFWPLCWSHLLWWLSLFARQTTSSSLTFNEEIKN